MRQRRESYATFTEFPELLPYLVKKLREIGQIEAHPWKYIDRYIEVTIRFAEPPKVYDWPKYGHLDNVLSINAAAGGCFMSPLSVTCKKLPREDSDVAHFLFDLSLDSRYIPLADHSPEVVKRSIDDFVERAQNGYRYYFSQDLSR